MASKMKFARFMLGSTLLLGVAVFQSFATGYSLKRRFWLPLAMAPLVVAVVMALLADLDSPHTGGIGISQNSMERLSHEVNQ